ncbi:aminoglycoside phosphotransferase family protein [Neobacillus sp. PS3-34]|uniref:aminoglycoside phosphotransferase family protein n=1 Tax=Neobacillus sp. PS3-34 TaxID=3070678 RepID=UPI0027E01882|nr:aminoglycoside phosphotransferase family protein [Neobacillus sp. PS3-34]WML48810.1 aminoglycoside phosphotransferase family protein [Neobacillus sp. PS3-34]
MKKLTCEALPEKFKNTIRVIHGEMGEKWLSDFNRIIEYCEQHWSIKIHSPFELSYNFVAAAEFSEGKEAVVKLCVPGQEFLNELTSLLIFNGNGMVKLLDSDATRGIMLLERIRPGKMLSTVENDENAARVAAKVMGELWTEIEEDVTLPSIAADRESSMTRIAGQYENGLGPISGQLLQEAAVLFQYMSRTSEKPYLLHGDLHHYNILSSGEDGWIAIDPKGLIGEREYDVIQYLLNKLPKVNAKPIISKRIDIFVEELGLDKARILMWGYGHSVLSSSWSVEEGLNEDYLKTINVFSELLSENNIVLKEIL